MKDPRKNPRRAHAGLSIRVAAPRDLTARDVQAWVDLESRAAEPNAYLSPHFILPAARFLDPLEQPSVFQIERVEHGQRDLLGLAVLTRSAPSRRIPVGHHTAYRSRHSMLSGLLLDRDWVEPGLEALLAHLRRERVQQGLELPQIWATGPLAQAIGTGANGLGAPQDDGEREQRAILRPADAGPQMLMGAAGSRIKTLDRQMRRLKERGEVAWRCHREGGVPASAVEAFLALEHAGWKGANGTSLRSLPADESFFKEMVAGFGAEGRALFSELTLDGAPIASISSFISGDVGFGFKIGWDPEFKAYSPGLLNEVEFIRHAPQAFADISYFDSGSSAGDAYINSLWPGRAPVTTASIPTTPLARVLIGTATAARHLKRNWKTHPITPAAVRATKPEWISLAGEGLSSLAILF